MKGLNSIENEKLFLGIFMDLQPKMKHELAFLKELYGMGLMSMLVHGINLSVKEQEICLQNVRIMLLKSENVNGKEIDSLINGCVIGLGWSYVLLENDEQLMPDISNATNAITKSGNYNKALNFYYGMGTNVDREEGYKYFSLALQENDKRALPFLGLCYECGKGVNRDYKKAIDYYEQAASLKDIKAYLYLGSCYCYGKGVEINYRKALEYFQSVLSQIQKIGEPLVGWEVYCSLGDIYYNGWGGDKDEHRAKEFYEQYRKACEARIQCGEAAAYYKLGKYYEQGIGIGQDYVKACYYYEKGIQFNDEYAMEALGSCYHWGKGVSVDYKKALLYYEKTIAHDKYSCVAYTGLGELYYNGQGISADHRTADQYFRRCVEIATENDAYADLGYAYENGYGVTKDTGKAIEYYKMVAEKEDVWALARLGWCYLKGIGVSKNQYSAVEYFQKASDLGDAYSAAMLSPLYSNGIGAEKNIEKGMSYLKLGAQRGNAWAKKELQRTESQTRTHSFNTNNYNTNLNSSSMQGNTNWKEIEKNINTGKKVGRQAGIIIRKSVCVVLALCALMGTIESGGDGYTGLAVFYFICMILAIMGVIK